MRILHGLTLARARALESNTSVRPVGIGRRYCDRQDLGEPRPPRADNVAGWLSRIIGVTRFLGVVLVLAALTASAQGQSSVTLAWEPSSGRAIAGSRFYDGVASRTYTNVISAGTVTTSTVSGLVSGATYFFAVTAYDTNGQESDFSSEVSYTVPLPTNNAPIIALTSPANGTD